MPKVKYKKNGDWNDLDFSSGGSGSASIDDTNTSVDKTWSSDKINKQFQTIANKKVDKVDGKGLSTNDYTAEEKQKLEGLNNYVHPSTHDASIINQDSTHRFVTDEEKIKWNSQSGNGSNVVVLTQEEFDALENPDENTIYAIKTESTDALATQDFVTNAINTAIGTAIGGSY